MYKTVLTRFVIFFVLFLLIPTSFLFAQDQLFLLRYVTNIRPLSDDLTTNSTSATYKPIFGAGDRDAEKLKGIVRYGELTVDPGGTSAIVSYPAEEQIYYILEGKGTLLYDGQKVPVKKNDYMYVSVGVKHGILNSSDQPVRLLVMGYRIPSGTEVPPTPKLMMASADDVNLHTQSGHGPTTLYKLLMGTTESTVDRLAAAQMMTSMFIMDFAAGGTNIPHQHAKEEEIYYVLRGRGIMVAGLDGNSNELRHPCMEGDAFFFAPNTRVGFYSSARAGEEHDLILAVRSTYPTTESSKTGK